MTDDTSTGGDESAAAEQSGDDPDWQMAPDSDAAFKPDPETVAFLREIAEDIRGDSSESKQLAAILYRVSDLYEEDGGTSPEEIYLNVRHIMNIKEQGGIKR